MMDDDYERFHLFVNYYYTRVSRNEFIYSTAEYTMTLLWISQKTALSLRTMCMY